MTPTPKSNKLEVRLELSHFDDITHEEISRRLGLQPSSVYVKGQPYSPQMRRLVTENRWLFNLYDAEQARPLIEHQLDELLRLVQANRLAFISLCKAYTCGVFCLVTIYRDLNESTPAIYLEKRHVRLLHTLSALFDVDIYVSSQPS
ncbi:MAG: DUF4279 domain-containing protein [Hymenobacter sp.]|nr:MAG: DUF4279 domain-containing protein [Hymenobacter sp.]